MTTSTTGSLSGPLIIEKTYAVPAEKVWSALTDPKEMKHWYFNIPEFKPEVGFAFSFSGGTEEKQYEHLCVVTQAVKDKMLAYSWRYKNYPGNSEVRFELIPDAGGTRVKVTHSGIDSFPKDDPNFSRESFTGGWNYIFGESLAKYLDSK